MQKRNAREMPAGATQNRNEFQQPCSGQSPKTEFSTKATVQTAASRAVIVFNSGRQVLIPIMEHLNLHPGPLCIAHLAAQDDYLIKRARAKEAEVAKKRRKSKRAEEKCVEEVHIEEEGVTYAAWGVLTAGGNREVIQWTGAIPCRGYSVPHTNLRVRDRIAPLYSLTCYVCNAHKARSTVSKLVPMYSA